MTQSKDHVTDSEESTKRKGSKESTQDKKKSSVEESKPRKKSDDPTSQKPGEEDSETVDVSKLDMRVGKILNVMRHPDADSLYVEEGKQGEEGPPGDGEEGGCGEEEEVME